MPKYRVTLTQEEKDRLLQITNKGSNTNKAFKYARALLLCDQGDFAEHKWSTEQTAQAVGMTARSVINLKQRLLKEGWREHCSECRRIDRPVLKLSVHMIYDKRQKFRRNLGEIRICVDVGGDKSYDTLQYMREFRLSCPHTWRFEHDSIIAKTYNLNSHSSYARY